ncbi:unnamed protein product [Blepharisma stoltei]|uniref:Uncharacterized protein n=1 Tax=Blepharisma stoltei TaxID=1481888 RepID=A0AAU9J652_9CILI|nr:unnamed protein product [Blepharisma stoltei]
MVWIILIAFQLVLVTSNQFYNPSEQLTEIKGKKQYQNRSPADSGRSQTQDSLNRGNQNQNFSPIDSGSFKNPNEAVTDSRKVQGPNKSPINQIPNGGSAEYRTSQNPYGFPNSMNDLGRSIKDLNNSSPAERKLQENGCNQDQYLDSGTGSCTECHTKFPKCWSCDETACNYCILGNLNADGTCTACPEGCATCSQTGCISCYDHYYMDPDGECLPCDMYCEKCNATSCIKCYDRYFLNEFSYCTNCLSAFPYCQECDISGCQVCYAGYHLDSNGNDGFANCTRCSSTFQHCDTCDKSGCQVCLNGYYVAPDGKCNTCDKNCLECNILRQCIRCDSLFYLDSNYKCQPCSSNCTYCDQRGCGSCQRGYYLDFDNFVCSKCPDHCQDCQANPSVCAYCDGGYYWSSEGKCKLCSEKFGDLCSICDETGCLSCDYNSIPNSNGTCISCSEVYEGCRYCNMDYCMDCDYSYYRDSDGKCKPCTPGCRQCIDSTSCMNCEYMSTPYSDGTCEKLSDEGIYLNALTNTYGFCSHGCRDCNNSTSCNKCWISGMINNGDGTCSCRSNSYVFGNGFYCQPCSDWGCKTCKIVSLTENNVWVKCIEPVSEIKCSDRKNMIENIFGQCECAPGYGFDYSSPRICQSCPSGCAVCNTDLYICDACYDPYYMIKSYGTCSCIGNMTYNPSTFRCENSASENSTANCAEYGTSGCSKCEQGHFLYDNSGVLECLSCSESCNSCDPHPGCYLCGTTVEKESSTCTSDNSVGYLTSFEDGNLILDFAYDLPEPLSLKEIIIKSPGNYDTSSWRMTQITPRQYMITTNLQDSDLPIDVRFKFNRG